MRTKITRTVAGEGGQVVILFGLVMTLMLIIALMVVDVGFYLRQRQQTQMAADAAALAGSQELPGSPENAREIALDYIEENGLDRESVTVTFECTSQVIQICNEAAGTYDTIVVEPVSQSPTFFGGVQFRGRGQQLLVRGV